MAQLKLWAAAWLYRSFDQDTATQEASTVNISAGSAMQSLRAILYLSWLNKGLQVQKMFFFVGQVSDASFAFI